MPDEIHRILNAVDPNFVPMSLRLSRKQHISTGYGLSSGFLRIDLRRAAKLARARAKIEKNAEFRAGSGCFIKFAQAFWLGLVFEVTNKAAQRFNVIILLAVI